MIPYDYYRIFLYVAKYNSFSKAALVLGNNQPNLSRCINIMENELGCRLFIRSNKGVALTDEGEKLYSHVKIAEEQFQIAEAEIKNYHDPELGIINIGASDIAMNIFLVDILESYCKDHPNVRLKIKSSTSNQAITALSNGEVDFAIVTMPTEIDKRFTMVPLSTFKEVLIIGPRYRDTIKPIYSFETISKWPIICNSSETSTHRFYLQLYLDHGFVFSPEIEVETAEQIMYLVSHTLGAGFYPEKLAETAIHSGDILKVPLDFEIPKRTICLVADKNHLYNKAAKELITNYILKNKQII